MARLTRLVAGCAVLPALVVALFLPCRSAAAAAAQEPPLIQWNPSESYPWGSQYDPRLERPIAIWRTAIPLSEVFSEIKRQTGVEVALSSLDHSSQDLIRLRLNLYLNQKSPPTLRALLVQLSWVLDYGIAYRPAKDGAAARYDLLCADPAPPALRALGRAMAASSKEQEDRIDGWRRNRATRFEEFHDAFALSPEELSERYRGLDDALLYDLTDEKQREVVSFLFGLPAETTQTYLREGRASIKWDSLTPEQKSLLTRAFPPPLCPVSQVKLSAVGHGLMVSLERSEDTPAPPGADDHGWGMNATGVWVTLMQDQKDVSPDDAVAHARAIGLVTTPEEESAYRQEIAHRSEEGGAQARARHREKVAAARLAREALSPRMETLLSGLALPEEQLAKWKQQETGPTLFDLQQAVATASGLNVVSDCLWQPHRPLWPNLGEDERYLWSPPPAKITGLLALRAATWGGEDGGGNGVNQIPLLFVPYRPAWQWGDAGSFLRFRSTERELWRASMWPEKALTSLDRVYETYRPDYAGPFTEYDLRRLAQFTSQLSDLQIIFGGYLIYAEPTPEEQTRQTFRQSAVWLPTLQGIYVSLEGNTWILRFLSGLSPKQWSKAISTGLLVGKDLRPDQQAALKSGLGAAWAPQSMRAGRTLLRGVNPDHFPQSVLKIIAGESGEYRISVKLDGKELYGWSWHLAFRPPPRANAAPASAPAASGR